MWSSARDDLLHPMEIGLLLPLTLQTSEFALTIEKDLVLV